MLDPAHSGARNYHYGSASPGHHYRYLFRPLLDLLGPPHARRLFEIGFGNGAVANELTRIGFDVYGIEPSSEGVEYAANDRLRQSSVYDIQASDWPIFDVVLSLEVIEHLYAPRELPRRAFEILRPGGTFILSTPYHGYWKNLAIALTNSWDNHWNPLWDHGHIKLWSARTLTKLLTELGFVAIRFKQAGRIPGFAKSIIAIAEKPLLATS